MRIGAFGGIEVRVHWSLLLLLGWISLSHLLVGHSYGAAALGAAFVALLFLCVVLHEFGHALTARRFGIATRDITLYPIGGVARLERVPRDPMQELLIALAGPAVNVAIALPLFLWLLPSGELRQFDLLHTSLDESLVMSLFRVNVGMVLFNLIPAFPMDGGRVLRALLATRMEYGTATRSAAGIGQALALAFGIWALLQWNPFYLFVAFFVYMGAGQEAAVVQAELAFRGVPVRGAMMTNFGVLFPEETLARALEQLLSGAQHDFPVVRDGVVVGLLTRSRMVEALGAQGPDTLIRDAMSTAPAPVRPGDSLEDTFQRMREAEVQTIPVVELGQIVGLITLENIGEFLMLRTAVDQLHRREAAPADEVAPEELPPARPMRRIDWILRRPGRRAPE
jgi:Zn-dependent protease/CBS domain-containing protein